MRQKINFLLLFLISLFALGAKNTFAQDSTNVALAEQYYQNKAYDKAIFYFEKIYSNQSDESVYRDYLDCFVQTQKYKKAEKIIKKRLNYSPELLHYYIDLGQVYATAGDNDKEKDAYKKAIKELSPSQNQILDLANAFIAVKQYDDAIETYKKGKKLLNGDYPFIFELAAVYNDMGNTAAMINEYLDALDLNEGYIQSVQNALQTSFGKDADEKKNEILKTELLKRIQHESDKPIFSQLLIWMQIQEKDFAGAFIQVKALDRRNKEGGSRMMTLAKVSADNDNYEVANQCYQYVIDLGTNGFNYMNARMAQLNLLYKKVVAKNNYSQDDLVSLENKYEKALSDLGKNATTVPMMKDLAHIEAFYLHNTDKAISLLNEAINIPQISANLQAECKLELGDVYLFAGQIWEASLRYSQVEKAFEEEPIGDEAKFRNAKISFYTGDFKWSKAQLDVLKSATSKLIANDAMALSLLISDNTAIDTNTVPLLMYAQADLLAYQNKDDQAIQKLDSINTLFPNHSLAPDIIYEKYTIRYKEGKYEVADSLLETILTDFPQGVLADKALFYLAQLNENKLNNTEKAKKLYEQILTDYPGSLYAADARERFRILRGDKIVN
ncbi:MAG TPA: tetratricopeptide repeat protein [Bacteroidia bacterium]|nr:tetratricopeptide repeat protein [Bacteroidia bacterium]